MNKHRMSGLRRVLAGSGFLFLVLSMGAGAVDLPLGRVLAAANLIQDPGFENTAPMTLTRHTFPWVGEETNIPFVVNDGHAHSGSQEAIFQTGGAANQGQLMQLFSCLPNTDYVASAWIGGTPGFSTVGQPANNDTSGKPTQRGFGVHIPMPGADPDGDGDTQGFDTSIIIKYVTITNNSSGSYQFYSFTFNSGAHSQLFVDFDANLPANSVLRVDDVSVTQVGGGGGGPTAPVVTSEPSSRTVTVGQTATFSVGASGTAPLGYQWEKNGVAIPGATGASYTTPPTALADSGELFRVVVSNSVGSVTSSSALLTVGSSSGGGSPPAPWKDGDVGSVGVPGSASVSGGVFTVKASGADIGGTTDSFNFVYQQLSGD
ncbi:MAG TPA: immunoglobulin domain-containing protein, partial [Planctomycetota bacterium]|nr:immunoglobulin domain-containing protein [Planctomycetota bacterium]